ncbi:MAG: carboxypeptidase-like regulatory domain-containing protein [Bacillus subtilis]|nr:carboxypeptidase-like regulatory domain-containing protein [Bacillus subtilis]
MKKIFFLTMFGIMFFCNNACFAAALTGSVKEEMFIQLDKTGSVVDSVTGNPIAGANISIPSKGISVQSNQSGQFNLHTNLKSPTIISVQAKRV